MDLDYPYWVEDENFDLDYHMRHIALPKPGDWSQFRKQVARLVARPLDMSRPPWEMTVIDGLDGIDGLPPGCFATVLKVHHSAIDGMAGVALFTELLQLDPNARPTRHLDTWEPEPVPRKRDLLRMAGIHGVTRPITIARHLLSNATRLAQAAIEELRHPEEDEEVHVPTTILTGSISAQRVWDEARCSLEDLKRARRRVEGATVNDVCMTIVGGAMRRYLEAKDALPEQTLYTIAPISTRTPEQAKEGGNHLSLMRIALHTDIQDPLKRLEWITRDSRKKKAVQDGVVIPLLLDTVQNLPGALVGIAMRAVPMMGALSVANTMVTNVPGPPVPYYMLGARAVRVTGCPPLMDGGGLLHSVCSYCGDFVFVFTACPRLMPDSDVDRDRLEASVKEVVAIGI